MYKKLKTFDLELKYEVFGRKFTNPSLFYNNVYIPINIQLQVAIENRDTLKEDDIVNLYKAFNSKNKYIDTRFVSQCDFFNQDQLIKIITNKDIDAFVVSVMIPLLKKDMSDANVTLIAQTLKQKNSIVITRSLLIWMGSSAIFEFTPAVAGFLEHADEMTRKLAEQTLEKIKKARESKRKWLEWYRKEKSNAAENGK